VSRSRAKSREVLGKEGAHGGGIDVLRDEALADAAGEDEGELAARHLLVLADGGHQAVDIADAARHVGELGRQADGLQMGGHALGGIGRAEPKLRREAEGLAHADGHRLAMDEAGAVVARGGLQRMAEGVAEIEQGAVAGLGLVASDDGRLGAAGGGDGVDAVAAALEDAAPVRLQPGEEAGIIDEAVLRHLGIAGAELAGGERVEHVGVGQHEARLIEGADKVLAVPGVDAGLAADG
jgi:hypothetical protein